MYKLYHIGNKKLVLSSKTAFAAKKRELAFTIDGIRHYSAPNVTDIMPPRSKI